MERDRRKGNAKHRAMAADDAPAAIVMFVFGGGLYGSTYLTPLFLQTVQGSTALSAGLMLVPPGLVMMFIFPLAGFMTDKIRPNIPVIIGLTGFTILAAVCALATRPPRRLTPAENP